MGLHRNTERLAEDIAKSKDTVFRRGGGKYMDLSKGRVSIVSPCYNGAGYVARMLESVLDQTYKNIEMICIDDGSTDETSIVIKGYIESFYASGRSLIYLKKVHEGQAAALNLGLKHISGEYLSWIDCDDFLTTDSVEKKVKALEQHPEYSIVTSDLYVVDETNISVPIEIKGNRFGSLNYQPRQFFLTLEGLSLMECHCHMLRVEDFMKINPMLEISTCKAGQNYQMLLPMYYYYNRFFIDEPLAYYVIRKNSHYHSERSFEQEIERLNQLNNMLLETFESMKIDEFIYRDYIQRSTFTKLKWRVLEENGRS